jgi:hypothetical protein
VLHWAGTGAKPICFDDSRSFGTRVWPSAWVETTFLTGNRGNRAGARHPLCFEGSFGSKKLPAASPANSPTGAPQLQPLIELLSPEAQRLDRPAATPWVSVSTHSTPPWKRQTRPGMPFSHLLMQALSLRALGSNSGPEGTDGGIRSGSDNWGLEMGCAESPKGLLAERGQSRPGRPVIPPHDALMADPFAVPGGGPSKRRSVGNLRWLKIRPD